MQSGTIVDNRFRIDERAGQGGMGIIYRARESTTGKMVAIKVMQSKDPTDRARFFREAQVLSSLSSPTIVACLGHGVLPSDEPWMAMEWVEGEDLATRLESGPLVPDDALLIVQAIVQALEVAHAQGIVHRDLKPANILLEGRDPARARLIDFGIARMRHAHTFTEFGAIVGTPAYMAPEQIRGAHNVDERADLYALGVILFECLTGRPPFLSPSFIGIMTQALFERAPRLRDINPALSPVVDDLVDQLLAKDPQQRLGPASAVREALNAVDLSHRASSLPPRSVSLGLTEDELQFVSVVLVSRKAAQPVSVSAETIS
ncbi:MAG TPA: serine/threonine-protein kinase, partial [Polyangium sp.]|nr:serine/threonine-protein kinase [Polyangium sp.]